MSTCVRIVNADIAAVKAHALITAINSTGLWAGAIDGVIMRTAGSQYHQQAASRMPLESGNMVLAVEEIRHCGGFRYVLFVVDDLVLPLHQVILNALLAAHGTQMTSVSLPTIRMGGRLGVVERNEAEAVQEMAQGVSLFLERCPNTTVTTITFVVYNNPPLEQLLRESLSRELVR